MWLQSGVVLVTSQSDERQQRRTWRETAGERSAREGEGGGDRGGEGGGDRGGEGEGEGE